MHTAPAYVTAAHYAARTGTPLADLRAMLRNGAIKGAIRVGSRGSEWRIPDPDAVPGNDVGPRLATGAGPDTRHTDAQDARGIREGHVTSSRVDTVAVARAVSAAVSGITTRPARALTDLAYGVAIVAVRHRPDPDGRCQACRWPTYPCPDVLDLEAAMTHVADQILAGVE